MDHAEKPPKVQIFRLAPPSGQNVNRDFGFFGRPKYRKHFPWGLKNYSTLTSAIMARLYLFTCVL